MTKLTHKIDFVLLLTATNANPNGDPLNGNRPREDYEGRGEISDVCIKRKLRNRLQDLGAAIFVQSADRRDDDCRSLNERASAVKELAELTKSKEADSVDEYGRIACGKWYDVRAFGQVFAFKGDSVSVGVRGPVSIHQSVSVSPVDIVDQQITKSVNSETTKEDRKSTRLNSSHRT